MKKVIIPIVLLIVIITAVVIYLRTRPKIDESILKVSGNVEITEVNLGFKYPGRIMELTKSEGNPVTTSEKLAVIDSAELESQITQGKAVLAETQVKLEELHAGARPQELEQAKANLRNADAEVEKAAKDFQRAELLFKNGAISEQQYDAAKRAIDVTRSQRQNAQQALSLVKEGPRKEVIRGAETRINQARASINTLQERLKDTVLTAPMNGIVLKKNVELGETVASGIPVYTLGDLENPWIKVYVKEDKLGKVKVGQKAEITVDSFPGKVFEGTITYISSEAEFTPKNVQTQEERVKLVFGVKVTVKNPEHELKPGMPADVTIKL